MVFTFCTSGAIINKAGANSNTTARMSGAILQQFYDNAQGVVNVATRYDWVANSGAMSTNFNPMLAEIISDLAAIDLIAYDMSGYTSRGEAESMINVLHDKAMNGITFLKNIKRPEVEY